MIHRTIILALLTVLTVSSARGDTLTLSDMRSIIGRACPSTPARVALIDANARCDPQRRETKACDAKYEAPSKPWHACYEQVFACRREVDEQNQTIYDYNDWVEKCRAADEQRKANANPFPPGAAKGNTQDKKADFSSRLDAAKARNDRMDEIHGKQREQFSETIERKRVELQNARREEARLREQLRLEREEMRRVQLMRQLQQQEEERAIAENALESFIQGFASGFAGTSSAPAQRSAPSNSGSTYSGGGGSSGRGGSGSGGCYNYVRGSCEATH